MGIGTILLIIGVILTIIVCCILVVIPLGILIDKITNKEIFFSNSCYKPIF